MKGEEVEKKERGIKKKRRGRGEGGVKSQRASNGLIIKVTKLFTFFFF